MFLAVARMFFLGALLLWPLNLRAAPPVPEAALVTAASAIVYDLDNDAVLFEQNADAQIPPASLTKIMSMLLARDFIQRGHANFNTPVTVSPAAAGVSGSRMGLRPRETVSLKKLLMGMAVSSGNDASSAVAEAVGGSQEAFVKMMNVKARELGMTNTVYRNPHGLPAPGQVTTARDMLTLSRAYLRAYPDALNMHNTKLLTHGGYTSWNKNPLLGQYPGADGLKSGWIRDSGHNLVFTATRAGKRLLAVILGAPDVYTRAAEACRLLDAGFMVCDNDAVSVAAALDFLPVDESRVDPLKTGRDAGLLKKQRIAAQNRIAKINGKNVSAKSGKNVAKGKKSSKVAQSSRKTKKGEKKTRKSVAQKIEPKKSGKKSQHANRSRGGARRG